MEYNMDWEERYATGELPWDSGRPSEQLVSLVSGQLVQPCPAMEVGCGTGTNAVWLAQQGFTVTGFDLSSTAIEDARAKAEAATVQVTFVSLDLQKDAWPGSDYGFVFDRGCFHSFHTVPEREIFSERVAASPPAVRGRAMLPRPSH